MELIKNFGIEPTLFAAQVVNFLIILYILKRFMYKPVLDMLKNREKTIKLGLQQAEEGKKFLEDAEKKQKQILKTAQVQSVSIVEDAKTKASQIAKDAEMAMKKQTEKMLKESQLQIQEETKKAEERLSLHVSTLAVQFLRQSLKDLFSEKDQEEIMIKAMRQLKKTTN